MKFSIKNLLKASCITMVVGILLISIVALLQLRQTRQMHQVDNQIDNLHRLGITMAQVDQRMFASSAHQASFFFSHTTNLLNQHDSLMRTFSLEQQRIDSSFRSASLDLSALDTLNTLLSRYDGTIQLAFTLMGQRGFEDTGLEGKIRRHAQWLEKYLPEHHADLLRLGGHEKNYSLRHDPTYVRRFHQDWQQLFTEASLDSLSTYHLKEYQSTFTDMVAIKAQLGLSDSQGLQQQATLLINQLHKQLHQLTLLSHQRIEQYSAQSWVVLGFIVVLAMVFALLRVRFIARHVVAPLQRLTHTANDYITSDYVRYHPVKTDSHVQEIAILTMSFNNLVTQLQSLLAEAQKNNEELNTQNEELVKTNQELDMFVYSASHDLRSPLMSLEGLVHLCRVEQDEQRRDQHYSLMTNRIHRLDGFIQDIVDYARNNRQQLRKERLALDHLIEEILTDYEFLEQYPLILKEIDIVAEDTFHSDPSRVSVILKNLLSNAIRYYDAAKRVPFLRISGTVDHDVLHLTIEDNGVGIPRTSLPHVFEMFYRASTEAKGSGLGLFIVQETVRKLGGEITVASEYGAGTRFQLMLPNLKEAAEEIVPLDQQVVTLSQ